MILPDVNLLLYAHNSAAVQHVAAREWWEVQLNGTEPVALCWVAINGFLRISTHPRILEKPLKSKEAVGCVEDWIAQLNVLIIEPGSKFQSIYFDSIKRLGTAGNLTTDAYLASLAIEHQAVLQSNDADFAQFSGLRWKNPLG